LQNTSLFNHKSRELLLMSEVAKGVSILSTKQPQISLHLGCEHSSIS
jgi:hypothetical protein